MAHTMKFEEIPIEFYLNTVCDKCIRTYGLTEIVSAMGIHGDKKCSICADDSSTLHFVWEEI